MELLIIFITGPISLKYIHKLKQTPLVLFKFIMTKFTFASSLNDR